WTGAEATFDSSDPGVAKEVVVRGLALTGADAGNYVFAGSATTRAAIRRFEPPPSVAPGLDAPTPKAPSPDREIESVIGPRVDEGSEVATPSVESLGGEGSGGAAPGLATILIRNSDGRSE